MTPVADQEKEAQQTREKVERLIAQDVEAIRDARRVRARQRAEAKRAQRRLAYAQSVLRRANG